MPVPRTLDGFDVTAAVARMLDQPALWWQSVGLFVEHFADWEQQWRESTGDDAQERKRVHALRSAAANVGASALAEAAAALEIALQNRLAGQATSVPDAARQRLLAAYRHAWGAAAAAWNAASLLGEGRAS